MKIRFHGTGCVSRETMDKNIAHCRSLNLPDVKDGTVPRLAVIGGGHSILAKVNEMREFDGDRWIVAGAHYWCQQHGIDGVFFNIDPQPLIADLCKGVKRAILATCTAPEVFEALKGKDVQVFDLRTDGESINHGPSAATATPMLAMEKNYRKITFYGCDSSYPQDKSSHAYENVSDPLQMLVRCYGENFLTTPTLLMQCEYLSETIRALPSVFSEESGGLLRAMIENPDYDITHGSVELRDFLWAMA